MQWLRPTCALSWGITEDAQGSPGARGREGSVLALGQPWGLKRSVYYFVLYCKVTPAKHLLWPCLFLDLAATWVLTLKRSSPGWRTGPGDRTG